MPEWAKYTTEPHRDMMYCAGVAQSVRAPPCHGGGRGFKSRHSRHFFSSHS